MNIIIIGPQGSGKSSQAKLLAEHLNLSYLSTGEMNRRIREEDSKLGRKVRSLYDQGILTPDDDMLEILKSELGKLVNAKGFVLDGYPRNVWQAKNAPFEVDEVFYLKVSDAEGIKRLMKRAQKERRVDDTKEVIGKRLEIYHRETEPVLDFYRDQGVLEEVDGERPIKEIFADILSRLSRDPNQEPGSCG